MEIFPAIPLEAWYDSKATMHRFLQVVGKVRLASSPRRNHWWNVPFHLTGRGLTTRPMGMVDGNPIFTIDFDLVTHQLIVSVIDGRSASFPLQGESVASFFAHLGETLAALGVRMHIAHPEPFDLPDADRPFAEDIAHDGYDPAAITRYWQVLSQVNLVLEEFSSRFAGKISPVHHFWHTFDIAVTRFSPRRVAQPPTTDPVTREAYSREVVSSGFWFGDDHFPEPAFYSYTAPEPSGLAESELRPAEAWWAPQGTSHLAVLRYADVRDSADPVARVLEFYESAYQDGARAAGWDVDDLACPGGVTDPLLRV